MGIYVCVKDLVTVYCLLGRADYHNKGINHPGEHLKRSCLVSTLD